MLQYNPFQLTWKKENSKSYYSNDHNNSAYSQCGHCSIAALFALCIFPSSFEKGSTFAYISLRIWVGSLLSYFLLQMYYFTEDLGPFRVGRQPSVCRHA
jgi:hypothetical protein